MPFQDARMNADGMVAYYAPLYEWLKEENARLGLKSGWDPEKNDFYPYDTNLDFVGICANQQFKNEKEDLLNI